MKIIFTLIIISLQIYASNLSVEGLVQNPFTLTKKDFMNLPQTTLDGVDVVCASGEQKQKPKKLKGVLLMQLVQISKIDIKSKKKLNQIVVLANAKDNYAVAFSYNELFNTSIGNNVLVVYENDSFSLYSKKDFLTGPRHVYNLNKIKIKFVE